MFRGRRMPPWSMAVTAMLCVQLSNGLSVPVAEHIGPAGTAWLRLCFGTGFLWLIARPAIRSLRKTDIPPLIALGIVTGFMIVFLLSAIERIPIATAVPIEFLGPLAVAAIMSKRRTALVWPVLALVGIVLLAEPWRGRVDFAGVGFALAAGIAWGLYNILTQHVGDRFSGVSGLSLTIPVAALATMPFGLPQVLTGDLLWWVIPATAVIALLTPVIAFGLEILALKRMTHTAFGTLLAVEPAIGAVIGLIVLAQQPGPLQLLGIAIVVIAGAAAQRGGLRRPVSANTERPKKATDGTHVTG